MISLPIPEGFEAPEGPFEVPVTVEVVDGALMVSAIAGVPVDEPMDDADASEGAEMADAEADFMSAVEQRMM
jgi:hypothetical protein